MTILKAYVNMMKEAESRTPPDKFEKHHIFPISIFGRNQRTVKLSYREHIEAHRLLWLGCLERYGENHKNTIKMAKAYYSSTRNKQLNDEEAAAAREAHAKSMLGENNPMYGKPGTFRGKKHSEKSKALLKKSKAARHDLIVKAASLGGKAVQANRTAEERSKFAAKMGAATKGISKGVGYRWYNNGTSEKKCKEQPEGWIAGRIPFSEESSLKKSIALKNRVFEKVVCPYCNMRGSKPVMSRYHFDFCRFR